MNRWLLGWLVGLALLRPTTAQAYCRSTACDPSLQTCPNDALGCPASGKPLQWPIPCVGVALNEAASVHVSYAEFERVVRASFDAWNQVRCDGQAPSISATVVGAVECSDLPRFNEGKGNANIVVFRDGDWPYADQASVLALTTVQFGRETGTIYRADMEIRGEPPGGPLTTGDDHVGTDLQSIITHEAGHFLGLAHSGDSSATMYASYLTGATGLRSLEDDDRAALCAAYPPGRGGLPACDPAGPSPRSLGLSSTCDGETLEPRPSDDGGGCRASAVGEETGGGAGVALVLAAIARRRRRGSTEGVLRSAG